MKCEMCHKNDAKTAIKTTIGGKERELYVCKSCADSENRRKHSTRRKFGQYSQDTPDSNFERRMWQDFDDAPDFTDDDNNAGSNRHWTLAEDLEPCPDCGTTVDDIRNSGLLGCPLCYSAFKDFLAKNVRLRGTFGGKTPKRRSSNGNKGR